MDIKVELEDDVSPFLLTVLREKSKWMSSALKSTGWWTQKEIKAGIKSGAPGGRKYAQGMPAFLRRKFESQFSRKPPNYRYPPLGELVKAVGYEKFFAHEGVVTVGWLSKSAAYIGSRQEEGFFTKVTDVIRRKFNMAGIKLSPSKTQIHVPARPTYKPMKPLIEKGAPRHFQMKVIDYLKGASERSRVASRRRYTVYY